MKIASIPAAERPYAVVTETGAVVQAFESIISAREFMAHIRKFPAVPAAKKTEPAA